MKIAYVTTYDPREAVGFSGIGYHMGRALTQAGCEVDFIGPLVTIRRVHTKALHEWHRLRGRSYLKDRDLRVARSWGQQADSALAASTAEVILSPGTLPLAFSRDPRPRVSWTDATFASMVDFYPQWSGLAPSSLAAGHHLEQRALDSVAVAAYSSEWAASSAHRHYGVPHERLAVIPFGANLLDEPAPDEAWSSVLQRSTEHVRLTFVGTEWRRKGGDTAVAVVDELIRRGVDARLTVVGCEPACDRRPPHWLTTIPFIEKSVAAGARRYAEILRSTHFLLLPSRAECTAIVLNEANAFGVPCLTTDVGGAASVVTPGVNGALFRPEAPPASWADWIIAQTTSDATYRQLARRSLDEFARRLSWRVAADRMRRLLERVASGP